MLTLALACIALACSQSLPTAPTAPEGALLLAQESGDITVTYYCGNTFLFRNASADTLTLHWRVRGIHEEGDLFLPARIVEGTPSETYLTTTVRGPLEVYQGARVLRTVPNEHKPQCEIPVTDTTRPPVPNVRFIPSDTAHRLSNPTSPGWVYLRRFATVRFYDSVPGRVINSFIQRRGAIIRGGNPRIGEYLMEFPDPATTWDGYLLWLRGMQAEPGLQWFDPWADHGTSGVVEGLFPVEGASIPKMAWFDRSSAATWSLRAIRAPLAWGCQSSVAGQGAKIAVLEWDFEPQTDELGSSLQSITRSQGPALSGADSAENVLAWHGMAVSGVIAAAGGNGKGLVGATWGADLHGYALNAAFKANPGLAFSGFQYDLLPALNTQLPRILTISSDFPLDDALRNSLRTTNSGPVDDAFVRRITAEMDYLLNNNPQLLIVVAIGNENQTLTSLDMEGFKFGTRPLLLALDRLRRDHAPYADRIVFVAGTMDDGDDEGGNRWWSEGPSRGSNYIVGETDLAAPAGFLTLLGSSVPGIQYSGAVTVTGGTSFAAPLVAGVAAQALAMDPRLSPQEVKRLLVEGAAAGTWNALTPYWGRKPRAVRNVPDGSAVFQLDAYSTLQLVARRTGAPLCGNQVWVESGEVRTSRASGSEALFSLNGIQPGWLFPYHGGKIVSVQDIASFHFIRFAWNGGTSWGNTGIAHSVFDSASGGAISTFGYTHDQDSTLWVSNGRLNIGARYGVPGRPSIQLPSAGTGGGSSSTVCDRYERQDPQSSFSCADQIVVGSGPSGRWLQEAVPIGNAAVSVAFNHTLESTWLLTDVKYSCQAYNTPWSEPENCYQYHADGSTQSTGTTVYLGSRTSGNFKPVIDLSGRITISVTSSEDGSRLALFSAAVNGPGQLLNPCYTTFYQVVSLTEVAPDGAGSEHVSEASCDAFGEQGSFGATRQMQAAAGGLSRGVGFTMMDRAAMAAGIR